ncbi:MAG: hypothetical protein IKC71_03665 [Clostridia bacterium]|nr:hypothetical protein [Clostridia bacterium]
MLKIQNKKLDGIVCLDDKSDLIKASFIASNIFGNRIKIEKFTESSVGLNKELITLFLLITVKGGEINLEGKEEFLPLFLTTASFAVAKTNFVGVDLTAKNTLDSIKVLKELGVLIEIKEDKIEVDGRGLVRGKEIDVNGLDESIVFSLIVAGTVSFGEITIVNETLSTGLKEFLQIFESLGGVVVF